jgi:hypothetical protein
LAAPSTASEASANPSSAASGAPASSTSTLSSSASSSVSASDARGAHHHGHHHRRAGDAYGRQDDNLSQRLQGLVSALASNGSGSSSPLGGALARLQSDFQALVGAVNPSAGSGASAPTLSGFLQALATDLGAGSAAVPGTTGTLVNATA